MRRLEASGVIFAHLGRYPLLNLCNQPFKYLESSLIFDGPIKLRVFKFLEKNYKLLFVEPNVSAKIFLLGEHIELCLVMSNMFYSF